MSSLLLSQSIMSSTENSLREKSLQRNHQQRHLHHPKHIGQYNRDRNRDFNVSKNDSYQYNNNNNRPQLIVTEVPDFHHPSPADLSKFCWLIFVSVLVLVCKFRYFRFSSFLISSMFI